MNKKIIFIHIFLSLVFLISAGVLYAVHRFVTSKTVPESPLVTEPKLQSFATKSRVGSFLYAKNLIFRFKKNISLEIPWLKAELVPKANLSLVNFDDVNAFTIKIHSGEAFVSKEVLMIIFKDYVFNYPNAPLKLEKLEFPAQKEGENLILLSGEMDFIFWLKFEMLGKLSLNRVNNTLIINAEEIKSLGISQVKPLLGLVGLSLEKLLPVPKGRGIEIKENQIIAFPFQLFPPPNLQGTISNVEVQNGKLKLLLNSEEKFIDINLIDSNAKNYLFITKGDVKFGKLFMVDAKLQMIDSDPNDYLDFYMEEYFKTLTSGGKVNLLPDSSLKVIIPDYGDVFQK